MVFSSAPLYIDPHNWHHQQQQAQIHQHQQQSQQLIAGTTTHGGGGGGADNLQHQIAVHMPPPVPSQAVAGGNSSSIRPGSMADRARQANIPQPEPGLKCPRCESTNTKFCYFNNYSLTQPRHFCKMCRRYWTRGGALRNVPVGGGCRRNNKRSNKSGGGASKSVGEHQTGTGPGHNSTSPISSSSNNTDMNNNNNNNHVSMLENSTSPAGQSFQPRMTQFPLLASLQGLTHHSQYGSPTSNNLGLNFGGMISTAAQAELGFHIGSSASSGNSDHQWRPSHFPNNFLAAFDPPQFTHRPSSASSSLYHLPIDHQSLDQQVASPVPPRSSPLSIAINQQLFRPCIMPLKNSNDQKNNEAAEVKAEEAAAVRGGMNSLSMSVLGMSGNSQYWTANNSNNNNSTNTTWTDLSGINSSTTRLL